MCVVVCRSDEEQHRTRKKCYTKVITRNGIKYITSHFSEHSRPATELMYEKNIHRTFGDSPQVENHSTVNLISVKVAKAISSKILSKHALIETLVQTLIETLCKTLVHALIKALIRHLSHHAGILQVVLAC